MLNSKRINTEIEILAGLGRGSKQDQAVRFRDLGNAEVKSAVQRIIDGTVGKDVEKKLDEHSGLIDDALAEAHQAAEDAQNANLAAGAAHDFADAEVQKALRNLGGVYELMESGFALSSEAEGRERQCLNDTFLVSSDWARWTSAGIHTVTENVVYPIGRTHQFEVTETQNDGLSILNSPATIWTGPQGLAGYVVEVCYTLLAGSVSGAGVRLRWINTASALFDASIPLSQMEQSEIVAGTARIARAVLVRPAGFTGSFSSHSLHVFANGAASSTRQAKKIAFHRVNIRRASADEVLTGKVSAGVKAYLSEYYMTAAKTDTAIANYDMSMNASLVDTFASVSRSETAIASLNGSVARFRNVVTVDGEHRAGIEAVAFSGTGMGTGSVVKLIGDDVVAEGTLSAGKIVVHDGSGNLFPDPQWSLRSFAGWTLSVASAVSAVVSQDFTGSAAVKDNAPAATFLHFSNHVGQGSPHVTGPFFPAEAGNVFNLSVAAAVGAGGYHQVELRIVFFNRAGASISAPGLTITDAPPTWQVYGADVTAPAGTVRARIQIISRDGTATAMSSFAAMTNFAVVRKRTGATLITPNSLTSALINTTDFNAAGLAIFGGTLRSDNFNAAAGTGWQIAKSGELTVPDASITNAKIGNVLQSTNFVSGESGAGWRIQKSGAAEFNSVTIRRQVEVISGTVDVGTFTPTAIQPVWQTDGESSGWSYVRTGLGPDVETNDFWALPGKVVWVRNVGIPISAWQGQKKTYIATAGMTATVSGVSTPDTYWGWKAEVMALTRWNDAGPGQNLRLKLEFWSRNVANVANCIITWKIYEVS